MVDPAWFCSNIILSLSLSLSLGLVEMMLKKTIKKRSKQWAFWYLRIPFSKRIWNKSSCWYFASSQFCFSLITIPLNEGFDTKSGYKANKGNNMPHLTVGVTTYPCPRYLLLAPNSSYQTVSISRGFKVAVWQNLATTIGSNGYII